jgi:hypothetical protein
MGDHGQVMAVEYGPLELQSKYFRCLQGSDCPRVKVKRYAYRLLVVFDPFCSILIGFPVPKTDFIGFGKKRRGNIPCVTEWMIVLIENTVLR